MDSYKPKEKDFETEVLKNIEAEDVRKKDLKESTSEEQSKILRNQF